MARCPFARWKPLGPQSEPRLRRKNIIVLHTMVGSLNGTDSYFRNKGYSGVESHFGIGHDGTIYQWQDTSHQADAQLEGNDNCISIETADSGPGFPNWSGSDVPRWTPAQVHSIIRLVNWLCDVHDIPKRLVPDSGADRHGIGYHRQGVDPWRDNHAEHWSNAYAKVCPGARRIRQLVNLVNNDLQEDDVSKKDVLDALRSNEGQRLLAQGNWRTDNVIRNQWANSDENKYITGETLGTWILNQSMEDRTTSYKWRNKMLRKILEKVGVISSTSEEEIAKQVIASMPAPEDVAKLTAEAVPPEFFKQIGTALQHMSES